MTEQPSDRPAPEPIDQPPDQTADQPPDQEPDQEPDRTVDHADEEWQEFLHARRPARRERRLRVTAATVSLAIVTFAVAAGLAVVVIGGLLVVGPLAVLAFGRFK